MRSKADYERLEQQVAFLRKTIQRIRENPGDIPFGACDNSCICARPDGAATNGGCRCDEPKLRRVVLWLWRKVKFLEETIRFMRGSYTICFEPYGDKGAHCVLPLCHKGPHGTVDEVGEMHDAVRSRAEQHYVVVQALLAGMRSVEDILKKFSVSRQEAERLWEEYKKL